MEITDTDIENLRTAFFQKIADSGLSEADDFHPADIARIKANGDWLRRFLAHHDNEQADALKMLWDSCEWRKSFGANDITEKTINMTIVQDGSIFAHNRDKDGKALLIFKSKKHVKGKHDFDELKRVLIYWMERLEREESGDIISIFFDMDGAGLSNMDMEYTKYIIGLFKSYYPLFLNNIYIFEMAWVLNAAFKVIKSWLPPKAVQKIKFISKSNLKEYVEPEQALKNWGGLDEYVFEFVPEVRAPSVEAERKKVHFADRSPVQDEHRTFSDAQITSTSTALNHRLTITPADVIVFGPESGEVTASLRLKNDETTPLSYKIKTTSPEKFRVRPSAGLLAPGASSAVSVVLQPGYDGPGLQRDKFLVMSVPVTPDLAALDLTELWKAAGKDVVQHRLRCSLPSAAAAEVSRNGALPDGDRQLTKLSTEISKLHNELHQVGDEVRRIQIQQWVLLLLVGLLTALTIYLSRQDAPTPPPAESCFAPPQP